MIGTPTPDRLAILRDAELVDVAVNCLTVETDINCRTRIDPHRVKLLRRAMLSGSDTGELVIAEVEGTLSLIDGFHRYYAMSEIDSANRMKAWRLKGQFTLHQARWIAYALHWKAEKPLSSRERKEGFKAFVKAQGHLKTAPKQGRSARYKSYREIGTELGYSHQTIFNWMKDLFPRIADAMGREAEPTENPVVCREERALRRRLAAITQHTSQITSLARGGDSLMEAAREHLAGALRDLNGPLPTTAVEPLGYDF